jgi:predicted MPP superfamily phosphohydrolase
MKKSQIAIFVSVALTILLLAHAVVYEALLVVFSVNSNLALVILKVLVVGLPVVFISTVFLVSRFNNFFTRTFYPLIASWMGFLLYFFLVSCVLGFVSFFTENLHILGQILFSLAVLIGIYGVIHEKQTKIVQVEIKLPKLPAFWQGKKILFVSDLHLGQIHGQKFTEKVARKIKAINPDIIFIGGDLYDGVSVDRRKIIEPLNQLKPALGMYFVTGNHDGFTEEGTEQDIQAINQTEIKVLRNEMVNIHDLQIIGVNYRDTTDRRKLSEILDSLNIDPQKSSILLKHVPDHIDVVTEKGISLVLCGHTHRAQLWPLRFIPKLIYRNFDYGLKSSGNTQVHTSSGVGTWGPPLRVGTNSEILVISLTASSFVV